MGLFDKKYCDICGEKIGFLGNRKLEEISVLQFAVSEESDFLPADVAVFFVK